MVTTVNSGWGNPLIWQCFSSAPLRSQIIKAVKSNPSALLPWLQSQEDEKISSHSVPSCSQPLKYRSICDKAYLCLVCFWWRKCIPCIGLRKYLPVDLHSVLLGLQHCYWFQLIWWKQASIVAYIDLEQINIDPSSQTVALLECVCSLECVSNLWLWVSFKACVWRAQIHNANMPTRLSNTCFDPDINRKICRNCPAETLWIEVKAVQSPVLILGKFAAHTDDTVVCHSSLILSMRRHSSALEPDQQNIVDVSLVQYNMLVKFFYNGCFKQIMKIIA